MTKFCGVSGLKTKGLWAHVEIRRFMAMMLTVAGAVLPLSARAVGTWTPMIRTTPWGVSDTGNVVLLGDGRVLCSGPNTSTQWWTLGPDSSGSYENGIFVPVGNSTVGRLFNPIFTMRDGRVLVCGGEDVTGMDFASCEIFDPSTNMWTSIQDMPEMIGDTPSASLADGRVLILSNSNQDSNSFLFFLLR